MHAAVGSVNLKRFVLFMEGSEASASLEGIVEVGRQPAVSRDETGREEGGGAVVGKLRDIIQFDVSFLMQKDRKPQPADLRVNQGHSHYHCHHLHHHSSAIT